MNASLEPASDAAKTRMGWVHIGIGAFFRAHGAVYLQAADPAGEWSLRGVSLRSPDVRDALAEQDFNYTVAELSAKGMALQNLTILDDVLVAPEDPAAVLKALVDPAVKVVSLTVTEKGYCRAGNSQKLDAANPDIRHDLSAEHPRSMPGFLVRALQQRRAAGEAPFTVVSLDNLPANGEVTRTVVLDLAQYLDPELANWISENGCFPNSMVDRIVPRLTPEHRQQVGAETNRDEAGLVVCEPFRQWVLEDDFVGGVRPALERAGVQLTDDVAAFERMKLRMLNGTHSALAYLGVLAGFDTVVEAASDPVMADFLDRLCSEELIPTITPPPPGTDLTAYAQALLERYRNPGIAHQLRQIAMDGSQKLPQRILDPLFENQAAGRACDGLLRVLAGWMVFLQREVRAGKTISDPMSEVLAQAVEQGRTPKAMVDAFLGIDAVFGAYPVEAIRDDLTARVVQWVE